jgi:electron transfer flavoprotein alpha subunit
MSIFHLREFRMEDKILSMQSTTEDSQVKELIAARARTGDAALAVGIRAGKMQIQRVTYGKRGVSTVERITGWMPKSEAIDFLNGMGAN